ncbi:MAG: hypothetical protein R3E79_25270 [Caldilineaceae bacterium]
MKRFYTLITVVATLLATLCLPLRLVKASEIAQTNCTQATFKGSYQFLAPATIVVSQGTVIAIPEAYFDSSPAAYASDGTVTFDGNGHVLMEATADMNGELAPPITYDGAYTVNANCTVGVVFVNGARFDVRMVQADHHQRLVSMTPGFVLIAAN